MLQEWHGYEECTACRRMTLIGLWFLVFSFKFHAANFTDWRELTPDIPAPLEPSFRGGRYLLIGPRA